MLSGKVFTAFGYSKESKQKISTEIEKGSKA